MSCPAVIRSLWVLSALCLVLGGAAAACAADQVDPAALARARREVRMLDDLYKTAIVLVTKHYVNESSDLAAGDAFQALFQTMRDNGWHDIRLLDASGEPIDEDNRPRDDFERAAVQALLEGKPSHEQVGQRDGKPVLRSATPIPVVLEKCVMCHENYQGKKVIGALSYTLPLDAAR